MPIFRQTLSTRCERCYRWLGQLLIVLILGGLLGALGPGPLAGWAESMPATEQPPEQLVEADVSDIPSEKVSQFVTAYLQVVELVERREGELQQAETDAESLQIQRDIQAEAFELITDTGLTRQEYWQLLGLANSDPDFRERILAQLEDATP